MSATALSSACAVAPAARSARAAGGVAGGERHQQPVLRDVFVAGLGRGLLRGVEHAHQLGGDLRLAGAGALHLRLPGEFGLDAGQRRLGVAAGGADQAGGGAFLVIQQRLEQMLGRDALVEFADRDGAGGLQEAARRVR